MQVCFSAFTCSKLPLLIHFSFPYFILQTILKKQVHVHCQSPPNFFGCNQSVLFKTLSPRGLDINLRAASIQYVLSKDTVYGRQQNYPPLSSLKQPYSCHGDISCPNSSALSMAHYISGFLFPLLFCCSILIFGHPFSMFHICSDEIIFQCVSSIVTQFAFKGSSVRKSPCGQILSMNIHSYLYSFHCGIDKCLLKYSTAA